MGQATNLLDILDENCSKSPEAVAFYFFDTSSSQWQEMTWSTYRVKVYTLAIHLKSLGIKKGDCVAILSANRPEWIIADLAILSLGAVSVPIFANSSVHDISYILDHSGSKAIFVDQLDRLSEVKNLSPALDPEHILCFERGDLVKMGESHHLDKSFDFRHPQVTPSDLATIVYTSGTTGVPKGVMHSHASLFSAGFAIRTAVNEGKQNTSDLFFSFLPMSHVAERALVEIGSLMTHSPVVFARKVDTFIEDVAKWKPTILLCVPRLWEKIYERIHSGLTEAPIVKKSIFSIAHKLGSYRIVGPRILKKHDQSIYSKISDLLVGNALKSKLGFENVRLFLTGSAPTRPELIKFFGSFGIFIREVYGMTENMCLGSYTGPEEIRLTSCGRNFKGNEVKVGDDGEIYFKAPWNFSGYYKNPDATSETLTKDGWLKTGDLGYIDPDGYLYITGRKKELLKTSTGKFVAPVPIEDELKAQSFVEDAIILGDGRKYCVALISLPASVKPADATTPISEFENKIQNLLDEINRSKARHEQVKKIGILKTGFSVESGLLTPSLKLKRNAILTRYSPFIDRIYTTEKNILWE